MRLTEQQTRYFDTFGFLGFPGLFEDEADAITENFERVWTEHGGGHNNRPHDHQRRSALLPFVDVNEYLSGLIDDLRIDGVAASILGDDYNYTASDGNFYVGDTAWHSDGYPGWKYRSIKMAFYLDPVDRGTGCLRVIPGSHRVGDIYAEALQEAAGYRSDHTEARWGIRGTDVPAVALETQPGDMLVFNHRTKHASFGGGTRRRMFTLNFQERYRDEDLPALRDELAREARFWHDSAYGEVMVRTATPARMVHLEQRLANDDHLPEVVRRLREEMDEPSRG
jgi:ectoine hydroxylase-related dioxygenase (phytanoyl-CoA dioxygenase family)